MPKPHFPRRGGPQPAAWSPSYAPAQYRTNPPPPDEPFAAKEPEEIEAEIRRLHRELARAQRSRVVSDTPPDKIAVRMVWIALACCGAGLLFALYAILNHG